MERFNLRNFILFFVAMASLFSFVVRADDAPVIQVRSVVEVDGRHPQIVLGDVMIAREVSPSTIEALSSIRLADTPRPGESRVFSSLAIEQIFRQRLREISSSEAAQISLRIPTRVTVVRKSFRLNAADVEAALLEQLKGFCVDCVFEIGKLSLPALPTNIPLGSTWAVHLRHELPRGNFSIPLEVVNEDSSKRTYWITGILSINKKVPVAARAFSPGERIAAQDFTIQFRDVTFATDVSPGEPEMNTSVTARGIAAGEIIWRSAIRKENAVKYGDMVRVSAGADGWQISVDGVAQGAGSIGDVVNVKVNRTQKLISGTVIDKGMIEVR
jgi:flagella basal body P-ring formation protein FlgA